MQKMQKARFLFIYVALSAQNVLTRWIEWTGDEIQFEVVEFLLKQGCKVNESSPSGNCPHVVTVRSYSTSYGRQIT